MNTLQNQLMTCSLKGGLLSVPKDGLEGVGSFKMQVFHVAYAIEQGVDS